MDNQATLKALKLEYSLALEAKDYKRAEEIEDEILHYGALDTIENGDY